MVCPGRTYRIDSDATHTPQFHQVEGLVIDKGSHLGHLKWILHEFCKAFFEVDHINMRFRPSFFPFTEPSLEVDIQCRRDKGEIRFGEGEDWLEILGCGMVHPNVLRACGIDPDVYQGFAWGMGIDRIAMLKYGIADLRQLFESDVRWLIHYGFKPLDVPTLGGGIEHVSRRPCEISRLAIVRVRRRAGACRRVARPRDQGRQDRDLLHRGRAEHVDTGRTLDRARWTRHAALA